ncbi:MAG: AAA family ATPase [Rubrivivax sp.]|nr:AAA family ATPase [Rubrivivax sp.]
MATDGAEAQAQAQAPAQAMAMAQARERVASLQAGLEASEGAPVRLIETHISWVLLAQSLAYKFKKPVQLPFLDFSTLAARRRFCEEELRLNRRMAPALYLDVVDVHGGPQGPAFGGDGPVLDVAVRMRRFPDGALWSEMLAAGTLQPHHVDAMAQTLTAFHRDAAVAPVGSAFGLAPAHQQVVQGLGDGIEASLQQIATPEDVAAWSALRAWLVRQQQALAPLWSTRQRQGRVREGHGDLHLRNVLQWAGQATAFDGIEFDAAMRWIDVIDDMAFLAMDLLANQRRDLAFRFINAYLAASGDYAGLPALRYYMVCRALVRARVAALAGQQGVPPATACGAAQYLALAMALSRGADARLAITHGLPGSGKSFVAQAVVEAVGAIGVRSDVERKRLFELGALESSRGRVPGGIYGPKTTRRTYARLLETASVALAAGWPVVVDAAFLLRTERDAFARRAASLAVPLTLFDCRAELPLLRLRLQQRQAGGADPSEADAAVLDQLTGVDELLADSELLCAVVVDAMQPVAASAFAQRWLAAALPHQVKW